MNASNLSLVSPILTAHVYAMASAQHHRVQNQLQPNKWHDSPGERDLDMILINRKPQIQQLQLSVISVQQIPPRGRICTRTSHVLPQSMQSVAFFSILFWIIAIVVPDVSFERIYPVDLVGLFERTAEHRCLDHIREGRTARFDVLSISTCPLLDLVMLYYGSISI